MNQSGAAIIHIQKILLTILPLSRITRPRVVAKNCDINLLNPNEYLNQNHIGLERLQTHIKRAEETRSHLFRVFDFYLNRAIDFVV